MARPIPIRRSLILGFASVIVLLTTLLVGLTYVGATQRAERQSRRLLQRALGEVEARLTSFFQPPQRLLGLARSWKSGAGNVGGAAFLERAQRGMEHMPEIAGVRTEPLGTWTLADFEAAPIRWTRPHRLPDSNQPVITALTPITGPDGEPRLVAVDVGLDAISDFTQRLEVTENALVLVLVQRATTQMPTAREPPEAAVIGLPGDPRFRDPTARREAFLKRGRDLGLTVLDDAISAFLEHGGKRAEDPLRFESGGEPWWIGGTVLPLDADVPVLTTVVIPEHDLLGDHRLMRLWLIAGGACALALAFGIATVLARRAAKPVQALIHQTDRIRQGDFRPGEVVTSRLLEVQQLAEAHEEMRSGLQTLVHLEHEMKVARQIQQGTFPSEMPVVEGYELFGSSVPAEDTGGDTFNVIPTECGTVLMLADATGHGVGPALSAAYLHAMLRMAVRSGTDLTETVRHANAQLQEDLPSGRFLTAWFGVLDAATHQLQCFSCGQGPIYHYHAAADEFEAIDSDAPPMGLFGIEVVLPPPAMLEANDLYIVLSDGFHEAVGASKEQFEQQRVQDVIRTSGALAPQEIVAALHAAVDAFTKDAPADDDRTCVIVKRID